MFKTKLDLCRRVIVDTGSPVCLEQTGVEKAMENAQDSKMKCISASNDSMQMSKQGNMLYTMHDTIGGGGEFKMINEAHTSTQLPVPLFPVE